MRYEEPTGPLRGRRQVVLIVVLAVVLTAAAGLLWARSADPPSPSGTSSSAALEPFARAVRLSPDPVITARNWLIAYRTTSYTDPGPTTWTQRLAPLLTDPARSEVAQQAATGTAGASWQQFTAGHCAAQVTDLDAVIPPEAPRTATTVFVQVSGTVATTCTVPGTQTETDEPVSATLELHQAPAGSPAPPAWLVARRLY